MTRFEYLSVLISIIIGLGLSEVIAGWVQLLRARDTIRFYWVHVAWMLLAVLMIVQFWWGFWQFRLVETWSFPGLLGLVVETVVMVFAILLLTPQREREPPADLRSFYYRNSRLFFGFAAVLMVLLAVVDRTVGSQPLLHAENAIRLTAFALLAALAFWRIPWLHGLAAVTCYGLFGLFLAAVYAVD